ncbi:hypothetical protein [Trichoplusia ni ascovirus 2c]|uniref:hypothetical protein n=1 Tax=Trichoplusia ni ascovirus 2c TaxID=328615 RepID=UPI0000E44200|nr:hypothetical protein TNAV2c_gp040 [Trichoplusia ni ascovirus 2c]ABF70557.1 hypothetical protein [Trichoplusia ni ascovirus 2c]AUS94142.1 hypothetical protein [Trichoplusia ni ascovirus 6b]
MWSCCCYNRVEYEEEDVTSNRNDTISIVLSSINEEDDVYGIYDTVANFTKDPFCKYLQNEYIVEYLDSSENNEIFDYVNSYRFEILIEDWNILNEIVKKKIVFQAWKYLTIACVDIGQDFIRFSRFLDQILPEHADCGVSEILPITSEHHLTMVHVLLYKFKEYHSELMKQITVDAFKNYYNHKTKSTDSISSLVSMLAFYDPKVVLSALLEIYVQIDHHVDGTLVNRLKYNNVIENGPTWLINIINEYSNTFFLNDEDDKDGDNSKLFNSIQVLLNIVLILKWNSVLFAGEKSDKYFKIIKEKKQWYPWIIFQTVTCIEEKRFLDVDLLDIMLIDYVNEIGRLNVPVSKSGDCGVNYRCVM